jgi:hypothetical protein
MWIELTSEKLLAALSARESAALSRVALGDNQTDALAEIAANIAAEWRGGLRRVTVVDSRDLYVPDELFVHILADFRYRSFTRLPGMASLLDTLRVEEWRRANTVRDNLAKVSIVPPDADQAEASGSSGKPGPAIADPDADSILGW